MFSRAIQTRNQNDLTGVIIIMDDEANVTRIMGYVGDTVQRTSDRLLSRQVRRISCPSPDQHPRRPKIDVFLDLGSATETAGTADFLSD